MKLQEFSTLMLVVAAALIDDSGRILMQRRRLDGEHGGLWEFPGGKVEAGESPESALLREIEEELSINLAAGSLEPAAFASGSRDQEGSAQAVVILLYTCREWEGQPRCLDGEELGLFAPAELAGLEMPPLDYPLAASLVARLG